MTYLRHCQLAIFYDDEKQLTLPASLSALTELLWFDRKTSTANQCFSVRYYGVTFLCSGRYPFQPVGGVTPIIRLLLDYSGLLGERRESCGILKLMLPTILPNQASQQS